METQYRHKDSKSLKWVERVSNLMDEKFKLPGTNFRFGLDPILNLIPFLGDISGFIVSAVLVSTMARHGASGKVVILMLMNIVLDATIGAIPVLGQIFDFAYKANTRNIKLLKEHYEEGKHQGSGANILGSVLVVIFIFFLLFMYLIWALAAWLIGQI